MAVFLLAFGLPKAFAFLKICQKLKKAPYCTQGSAQKEPGTFVESGAIRTFRGMVGQ